MPNGADMVGKHPKRTIREAVDGYGRTPLHHAAGESNSSEIAKLIAAGADIDAQDDNGWTPLHIAAQASCSECTGVLLQAGANTTLQDSFGNTSLWRAVFESRGNGEIIQLLRQAGADPHVINKHGVSPASLAHTIANFNVVQFFSDIEGAENEA